MISLVCIDVDGTLVGSSGEPTDATWAAIDAVADRGVIPALCTARGGFGSTLRYMNRVNENGWHVVHAGAAVLQPARDEAVLKVIEPGILHSVEQLTDSNSWVTEFYGAFEYTVDSDDPLAVAHAEVNGVPFQRRSREELSDPEEVVRVQVVVHHAEAANVMLALTQLGLSASSATSPMMPDASFVSATPPGITKGTGIVQLAAKLGIDLDNAVMIGDGENDVAAAHVVGHTIAMENAALELKRHADYCVGHVDAGGLVEALQLAVKL